MRTLRQLAVGAALITALAGAGSAAATGSTSSGAAGSGLQQTALDTMQGKKPCGGGNSSVALAANQQKPGGCGCSKECPYPTPEPTCGPDQKVKKVKQECIYNVACDGELIQCRTTMVVPTCVPKNGPKVDA